jgi:iron complex transport system permease protein
MASESRAAESSCANQARRLGAWRRSRVALYFAVVVALLAGSLIVGIAIGSSPIPVGVVGRVLAAHTLPRGWIDASGIGEAETAIVWLVRTPRVLVAACVGASLAVAGAQMQGLFRNPLASPDIVGASSGAAFGAVVALASGLTIRSMFYLPVMAFAGALLVLFLVYAIATQAGRTPVATLLLAGVAVNSLVGAATSFLITAKWVRYEVAQDILFWLMGGLDSRTWEHFWLDLPCLLVGLVLAMAHARDLDVMLLGEEAALTLGVDTENVKRVVITGAALLAGGAVAVSGIVGFVGLVVPHVVRLAIGPKHRWLLPASALTGAVFLILADVLARTLLSPSEIRLGIITAVFGSPFFLWLLIRQQRFPGVR